MTKPLTLMLLAALVAACSPTKSDMTITVYEMIYSPLPTGLFSPDKRGSQEGVGLGERPEPGIEQGVSACYAGIIQGQLVMAGGCNFPEVPAAEGGKKRFYKGIYSITPASLHKIGELPIASAYGVSLSTPHGIVCAGGIGEQGALSSVYLIAPLNPSKGGTFSSQSSQVVSSQVESYPTDYLTTNYLTTNISPLLSLPCTLDNMAGAMIGNRLYLVGGNANGIPSNALYCLDLDRMDEGWTRLPDFPGHPRTQPVCAAQRRASDTLLYIWGGFAPATEGRSATLSTDGYCYNPKTQEWNVVAPPCIGTLAHRHIDTLSLAGGIATPYGDHQILCMGGVNKDIFLSALQREVRMKQAIASGNRSLIDSLRQAATEYMTMPPEAYHFNDRIMLYDTETDRWTELTRSPETARAGAALISTPTAIYQIGGELKPGIRVPRIVAIEPHP